MIEEADERPRQQDMEADAMLVFAMDESDESHHERATTTFHEEKPRMTSRRKHVHEQHQSASEASYQVGAKEEEWEHRDSPGTSPIIVSHENEAMSSGAYDPIPVTQSMPFALASPVQETRTVSSEALEQRVELMTNMLIDVRRQCESLCCQNSSDGVPIRIVETDSPLSLPRLDKSTEVPTPSPRPDPPGGFSSMGIIHHSLDASKKAQIEDLDFWVQERLTPVMARRRSSTMDFLGSCTHSKKSEAKSKVSAHPAPGFPLFPRRSFSDNRGKVNSKDPPNMEDSHHDSLKQTVSEVLGTIRVSRRASLAPPGDSTPKRSAEEERKTLESVQPITAHVVSEHEDHELLLQKLHSAVASLEQFAMADAKIQRAEPVTDADTSRTDKETSFEKLQNYPLYMACIAVGAGVGVGLRAALQRGKSDS